MYFKFDVPIHWICHTLLGGAVVGLVWAFVACPLRGVLRFAMQLLCLPYETSLRNMLIGGVLGVWLHVLVDSFLYIEMNPFWLLSGNPLYRLLSYQTIGFLCDLCLVSAIVVYVSWRVYFRPRANRLDRPPASE